MVVIGIDSGYNLGISIVSLEKPKLLYYKYIKVAESKTPIEDFCKKTMQHIIDTEVEIDYYACGAKCLIELPVFHGDKKGEISLKKGDLFYTYASAITLFNVLSQHREVELITPNRWKGHLKKAQTEKRVKLILGNQVDEIEKLPNYKKEHIFDSIGMCLSYDKKLWELRSLK